VELLAQQIDGVSSKRLARSVTERGIDFQPGEDFLNAMTEAGAQEDLVVALKAAKLATAPEPNNPTIKAREAQVLGHLIRAAELNRNRFHPEDAEPECRAAVQADPQNAFAHLALGSMLGNLHRTELEVGEFKEALRFRPEWAEAHDSLAWAFMSERELDAAVSEFREAVRLEPDNARAHRGLGQALEVKGDKQGGQEEKRTAEQLDPHSSVPTRIYVGGQVMGSRLVYAPRPKYPREAKKAHVEGKVRLEALVGTDGAVKDLKMTSGDPALVKAATEAVSRWTYKPTALNSQPVEVITEIDVNFTLR
jgi:TonB family protein